MSAWTTAVAALSPGLWWRLGEPSGTNLVDASGNSHAGTLSGSTITYALSGPLVGDSDTAMSFTGTNPVGQVAYGAWAEGTQFSVVCWFKVVATLGANNVLMARDSQGGGRRFQVSLDASGHLLFSVIDITNITVTATSSSTYSDGLWHMVTATYDQTLGGSVRQKIYADNSSTAVATGGTVNAINVSGTTVPFSVGNATRTTQAPAMSAIDEVVFWPSTTLTGAQHLALYNAAAVSVGGVASLYVPGGIVEVAFTSGYTTPAASRVWTDVTDYVEGQVQIQSTRGRQDEFTEPQPSRLSLTLNNADGRFTPEYASSAYYPNVKKGRPIRLRATTAGGNLLGSTAATVDTAPGVALWSPQGTSAPAVALSSTHVFQGTNAMQVTFTGGGGTPYVRTAVTGLTVGQQYTVSAYTYGGSAGLFATVGVEGIGSSAGMTTLSSYQRSSYTFTATATSHNITLGATSGSVAGIYWADAIQVELGPTASTFTTTGPTTYDVFMGYVDEWPVEWPDGSQGQALAQVTATSRQARLAKGSELKSIITEEHLYDGADLLFTLGEPQGATSAGNLAPGRSETLVPTQYGVGGTLTFGTATGPGTDGLTAPTFTPATSADGLALTSVLVTPIEATGDLVVDVECFFSTTTHTTQNLVQLADHGLGSGNTALFTLGVNASDKPFFTAAFTGGSGSIFTTVADTASVADGLTHHVSGRVVLSGGNATASILTDAATRVTGTPVAWAGNLPTHMYLIVGGSAGGGSLFTGSISYVTVTSGATAMADSRVVAHYNAGMNGFNTEDSGARIARYARLAGVPSAEISAETGLTTAVAHIDTTGQTPLALMQDVAVTEDGVLFDGKDGTLTFQARSHRYGSTSAFTLDLAAGDVEQGFSPKLDDQNLTNDVTANRPNGLTVRSTNPASITEYGSYRNTLTVLTTSDNEVQSRADWEVNRRGTPRVVVPSVRVNLTGCSPALQASLLSAEIGTRFTLTNQPPQAPSTTTDYFIEGIVTEITSTSYYITFNTSAAAYASVWTLDSATLSVLDSTTVLAY